jgi:hypothetical protein
MVEQVIKTDRRKLAGAIACLLAVTLASFAWLHFDPHSPKALVCFGGSAFLTGVGALKWKAAPTITLTSEGFTYDGLIRTIVVRWHDVRELSAMRFSPLGGAGTVMWRYRSGASDDTPLSRAARAIWLDGQMPGGWEMPSDEVLRVMTQYLDASRTHHRLVTA